MQSHLFSETLEVLWYKAHDGEEQVMSAEEREEFLSDQMILCADYLGLEVEDERKMFQVRHIFPKEIIALKVVKVLNAPCG
jgi:hypothetical protein